MEDQENLIETLIEKGQQYGKTSFELFRLKTIDKSADIISTMVSWLIVVIFVVLFFLILNIGIALWIGQMMGNSWGGFFVVSAFYFVLALIFLIFRKKLIKDPINNSIITQILE